MRGFSYISVLILFAFLANGPLMGQVNPDNVKSPDSTETPDYLILEPVDSADSVTDYLDSVEIEPVPGIPDSVLKEWALISTSMVSIPAIMITDQWSSPFQMLFNSSYLKPYVFSPIADLLQEVPSVFVKSYGQAGISTPSFRGTGAGHTQVFWNNAPINSPMLGQTDLSLVGSGMFSSIGVVHGNRSLLYGEGGLGGAINLSNYEYYSFSDNRKGTLSFGQEFGSFGNFNSQFSNLYAREKWWMTTNVVSTLAENDFPFDDISRPGAPRDTLEHSRVEQLSVIQQFGIGNNERGLTARVWLNGMDRELPPTMLTQNLTESQSDRSIRGQLEGQAKVFDRAWFRAIYTYGYDRLHYQNLQAGINSISENHGQDLNLYLSNTYVTGQRGFDFLQAGIRLGHDNSNSEGWGAAINQFRGSAFVHTSYKLNGNNEFRLVVRESFQGNQFTLPLGFLAFEHLFNHKSRLDLQVSRNARFPTINDRFWVPGGNPTLETENSWSFEAGFDQFLYRNPSRGELLLSLDGYASLIDNWIQWVPGQANIWYPENIQQVFSRGGEAFLEWKGARNRKLKYRLRMGYAFTANEGTQAYSAQHTALNRQLIYTPRHSGNLSGFFDYKDFGLTFHQRFTGMRYTSADHFTSLPRFALGEVRLRYTLKNNPDNRRMEFYGGIRNLWNTSYQAVAWRPMPGRNFQLGIRLQLDHKKQGS